MITKIHMKITHQPPNLWQLIVQTKTFSTQTKIQSTLYLILRGCAQYAYRRSFTIWYLFFKMVEKLSGISCDTTILQKLCQVRNPVRYTITTSSSTKLDYYNNTVKRRYMDEINNEDLFFLTGYICWEDKSEL